MIIIIIISFCVWHFEGEGKQKWSKENEHFMSGGSFWIIYCTQHEFLWPFLFLSRDFGLYFSKYDSCFELMAPRRLL